MSNKRVDKDVYVHTWDWKEQPKWNEILLSVRELDGKTIYFTEADTGMDEYSVIISIRKLTKKEADNYYHVYIDN